MGFFSWTTSDTHESIRNVYSGDRVRPVYLLQPNGEAPILEPAYEGYGRFGNTDAHTWLAEHNLPAERLAGKDPETIRGAGIMLECGDYHEDPKTGRKLSIFSRGCELIDPQIEYVGVTYDKPVPGYDQSKSANELITEGTLVSKNFSEYVKFPLKFSFDPTARYEDLHEAQSCPTQGYFSEGSDEDEDLDEDELT